MIRMVRGYRGKLEDILDIHRPFRVMIQTTGKAVYDTCCFGVDSADKLSDDRYMIFYNQPSAPDGSVIMNDEGRDHVYTVDLSRLPPGIVKLIFTVSIDGVGTMGEINSHRVSITQDGGVCAELMLTGTDLAREKAIIDIEIYNKSVWRCSAVARGFNGGLADLLKNYGGEIAGEMKPAPQPAPAKPSAPPPPPKYNPPRPINKMPRPERRHTNTQPPPAPVTPEPPFSSVGRAAPPSVSQPYSAPRQFAPPPLQPYQAPRPVTPQPQPYPQQYQQPSAPAYAPPLPYQPAPPPPAAPAYSNNGNDRYRAAPQTNAPQLADRLMKKISLTKDKVKLEKHVVNLSKCVVDLSKKSGVDLGNTRAKVVVALDYSGSMSTLYRNGVVQDTLNRLVPLGLTFDDNGAIDIFLFQTDFRKMPDLNLANYENYVGYEIFGSGYYMGGTNYAPVLQCIIEGYSISHGLFRSKEWIPPIVDGGDPTFVLFITDGENADKVATDRIIMKCSEMNVFIQFIGIGRSTFNYLEKLDDMPGRKRDNTGFTRMADLSAANDEQLYTNVLEQFSGWLRGMQ